MILLLFDASPGCCAIGVSSAGPAPERFAAEELQRYLSAITGGHFPIVDALPPEQPGFLVGELGRSTVDVPALSEDGYLMKRAGAQVVLLGGSPRATLYAVYHFLERYLDCRWLSPGDDALPTLPQIEVGDIDDVEEPVYTFRSVVNFPFTVDRMWEEADWMAKNRLNWTHPGINGPHIWDLVRANETVMPEITRRGLHVLWGGHTFQTWIPTDVYFEKHPEFFALVNGERRPQENFTGSLCLSNPQLQQEVARNILRFAAENPNIKGIDLWMNDTVEWCECAACRQLEGNADYEWHPDVFRVNEQRLQSRAYFTFVNQVARLVGSENPTLRLSPLAYFNTYEPAPDVAMEPNVLVGFTQFVRNRERPLADAGDARNAANDATVKRWRACTEHLFIYEYFSYPISFNAFSELLTNVAQMAEELRYYPTLGIRLCSSEGAGGYTWRPLVMYAYARLLWNPQEEPEAIIEDYCRHAYGDAAGQMHEFWLLQETREPLATRQEKSLAILQQAKEAAGDPRVLARLAHLEALLITPPGNFGEMFSELQKSYAK